MRRGRIALWLMGITALTVLAAVLTAGREQATQAKIVTVTRGNVANIAALTGRITFLEETLAYAAAPGIVSEVLVEPGERVAEGQAIMRLDSGVADRIISAWLSAGEAMGGAAEEAALVTEGLVIRAQGNSTVRQVLTSAGAAVMAGEPVAVLSSNRQAILCSAAEADVRQVKKGMQVILSIDGAEIGRAEVSRVGEVTADPLTGRMVCQVTLIPDSYLELPAGTAVDADIYITGREQVTTLPVEAVTERGTVWWVHEGRCTEIPAEIVLSDEMNVWVRLPEGLAVAIGELEEGQRVEEVRP